MPRFNVQNDKGEWACFSSVVDDFITDFMPKEEYQKWREEEYGRMYCDPIEKSNLMDYEEAMKIILCRTALNKGFEIEDIPEYSSPCDYCQFWNKKTHVCDIVKRQSEVICEDSE